LNSSIDFINSTSPFFLYVNLQAPHYPYSYPENESLFKPDDVSFLTNYVFMADRDFNSSVNRYMNAIHYSDKVIGLLRSELEKRNILNDTVFIITADHGETLIAKHDRIRHGFGVYEEEVKIPLIISLPGRNASVINERVSQIDLFPTLLRIMNISGSNYSQGGEMVEGKKIFFVVQAQNYKIGMLEGDVKSIYDLNSYSLEVYNITADPDEQNNLVTNSKSENEYMEKYGGDILEWYFCQSDYYSNRKYGTGEKINC